MDIQQLKEIVFVVLCKLNMGNDGSEKLIMGTAAQASALNPIEPLGLFGMPPDVHNWIWTFLMRPDSSKRKEYIWSLVCWRDVDPSYMLHNIYYAIAMCAMRYYISGVKIDKDMRLDDLAHIWKVHYDAFRTNDTELEFKQNFLKYLGDIYAIEDC